MKSSHVISYRNVVSLSVSSMCECFSTKKFDGKSRPTASACRISPVRFLKSFANSAMCSLNPGSGSSGNLAFSVHILKA